MNYRASSTQAGYLDLAWDGPARAQSLSGSVSPRRPMITSPLYESGDLPSRSRQRPTLPEVNAAPFHLLDHSIIEDELGCSSWGNSGSGHCTWLRSRLDRKIRNPTACDSIGYNIRKSHPLRRFLISLLLVLLWCCILLVISAWLRLRSPGIYNMTLAPSARTMLSYLELFMSLAIGILYSQGYQNVRFARESMVSLQHSAVTTAYSFLKTLRDSRRTANELQPLIYECLALLTAYPVALCHKFQGNNCEPDIPKYCQDTAIALYHMRDKGGLSSSRCLSSRKDGRAGELTKVDCFFEVFTLHLHREYERHVIKSRMPSQMPENILYNLRNHFENIVDWGNMHERRTPIVRENADLMSLSGRHCRVSSHIDAQPIALICLVEISMILIVLVLPVQLGDAVRPQAQVPGDQPPEVGFLYACFYIFMFSVVGAILITLNNELRDMWDPYGRMFNMFSWTSEIAMEIDNMLNEFYESPDNVILRKQSFHCPADDHSSACSWFQSSDSGRSAYERSEKASGEMENSEDRPQTV